jgi:hypothetical protein
MNDIAIDTPADGKWAELERRVQALEVRVAAIPDAHQLEVQVTERVKASLPPPVDPTQAPSFKDMALPIPNVDTIVATARTTWTLFELLSELNMLFWTVFDRRYHMAWITRIVSIVLLVLILTSQYWLPLAFDNVVGRTWEKLINLLLGFIMFFILHYETRRYKEWRRLR